MIRPRAFLLLLLLIVPAATPARADFMYAFSAAGQAPSVGQSPVFQINSGGTLALDVYLVEFNVTSVTSQLFNDGGLNSAGVRVGFGGGARTTTIVSTADIAGNPAFDDPTSLNIDLNTTGTAAGGVPAYSAGLNEAVDFANVAATAGTYNGLNTYRVFLGTFQFTASSSAGDLNTITNISAVRFDPSADYTVTGRGSVLDSVSGTGTASIKILGTQPPMVPEPASATLCLLGCGLLFRRSRQHRAPA